MGGDQVSVVFSKNNDAKRVGGIISMRWWWWWWYSARNTWLYFACEWALVAGQQFPWALRVRSHTQLRNRKKQTGCQCLSPRIKKRQAVWELSQAIFLWRSPGAGKPLPGRTLAWGGRGGPRWGPMCICLASDGTISVGGTNSLIRGINKEEKLWTGKHFKKHIFVGSKCGGPKWPKTKCVLLYLCFLFKINLFVFMNYCFHIYFPLIIYYFIFSDISLCISVSHTFSFNWEIFKMPLEGGEEIKHIN